MKFEPPRCPNKVFMILTYLYLVAYLSTYALMIFLCRNKIIRKKKKTNKTNCIIKNFGNISWKFWFVFGTAKVSTSNHFPDDMR